MNHLLRFLKDKISQVVRKGQAKEINISTFKMGLKQSLSKRVTTLNQGPKIKSLIPKLIVHKQQEDHKLRTTVKDHIACSKRFFLHLYQAVQGIIRWGHYHVYCFRSLILSQVGSRLVKFYSTAVIKKVFLMMENSQCWVKYHLNLKELSYAIIMYSYLQLQIRISSANIKRKT